MPPFHLDYDVVSPKARMATNFKTNLERLFARHGTSTYDQCFLRISNNVTNNAARATIYVLQQGAITSPLCFSHARLRNRMPVWITPDGWKAATITCSEIFTGESRVMDNAMMFRFALLDFKTLDGEEMFGVWHQNLYSAFSSLNAHLSEETRAMLTKVSKENILGARTNRVQDMIIPQWEAFLEQAGGDGSSRMTPVERAMAQRYEAIKENRDDLELDATLTDHMGGCGGREEEEDEAADAGMNAFGLKKPFGLLTLEQIASVLGLTEQGKRTARDMLYLLEAGLGCKMTLFIHFVGLVQHAAHCVWQCVRGGGTLAQALCCMLGGGKPNTQGASDWFKQYTAKVNTVPLTREFRAVLFIFSRMCESKLSLDAFEADFPEFLEKLTRLPDAKSCGQCFRAHFPQ